VGVMKLGLPGGGWGPDWGTHRWWWARVRVHGRVRASRSGEGAAGCGKGRAPPCAHRPTSVLGRGACSGAQVHVSESSSSLSSCTSWARAGARGGILLAVQSGVSGIGGGVGLLGGDGPCFPS
jgi:hypothetical protein